MHNKALDSLILEHECKPIVAVQGLGFVGSVMSLVCANALSADYLVLGVDVPQMDQKIKLLNQGVFPLVAEDPKIELYFNNALKKGTSLLHLIQVVSLTRMLLSWT